MTGEGVRRSTIAYGWLDGTNMERMRRTYDGSGGPSMSNDLDEGLISNLVSITKDVPDTCVGELG